MTTHDNDLRPATCSGQRHGGAQQNQGLNAENGRPAHLEPAASAPTLVAGAGLGLCRGEVYAGARLHGTGPFETSTQIVDTFPGQQRGGVVQGNAPSSGVGAEVDGGRARALQEAIALLSTVMTQTFNRDDCSDEFLNGMAYGVATYCSAIKELALAPAQDQTNGQPGLEIKSWAQRFGETCGPGIPADPQKRIDAMLAEIDELRAALANEYATIVLEKWEACRAQQDFSRLVTGDAEPRKDEPCAGLS